MKKRLFLIVMALMTILGARANDPVLYLRGEFNGWAATNESRMSVKDGIYYIHVNELDGMFKIADFDWGVDNWGCVNDPNITGVGTYDFVNGHDPANLKASNLRDVTLSFRYLDARDTPIKLYVTNGTEIPEIPEYPKPAAHSRTLPVLYINVYTDETHSAFNNEIISKDLNHKNYFSFAEYWLDVNDCEWMKAEGAKSIGSAEEPLPLEIKARGNWTRRGFAKKPFKLKLGKKQSMLGMTKSKHYAILAHADDGYGYMRNFVGFNLGKRIGLPWTPAQQPIEVYINGDYRGVYFLTESIRVGDDRVMIQELDDNVDDPALVSGGYLVELDNYDEENQIRMTEKGCVDIYRDMLRITWDTPELYSELQKRFVTDQFKAMNNAVGANSNELWSYLDLDDAARYYIVEEIISHIESYHGSTYLFRDRGEGQKWHFSPLWDCGNAFNGPTDNFFYNATLFGNTWIPSMRQNEMFNAKVKETWLWFMNNCYNGIEEDIDRYAEAVKAAAQADFNRWDGQPCPDGGQGVVDNRDMARRAAAVKYHLNAKTNWLKKHFGDYEAAGVTEEPARDLTPAAPLPEYALSGVENVAADATVDLNIPAEYYDITGRLILNPAKGEIVIERRGDSVRKIVY